MKILIVDNGTHYKKRLNGLLEGHEITIVQHPNVTPDLHNPGLDLIVLSGAYGTHSIKYHGDKLLAHEQEFIRSAKVPVIGICYSAQLIAHMYGARLSVLPGGKRFKGVKRIWNIRQTPFDFFENNTGRVWSSQRWRITDLPNELEAWCASATGVEIFRHRDRPVYGLQFHPEHYTAHRDGQRIFKKIIEIELKSKAQTKKLSQPILATKKL
ncbi:hypothetical protein HYW36_02635 [Candidatus Saccharibacteria bacterium]|nr:hypothetical protein [Candidatus Saccharibacteria bacterium]